MDEGGEAFTSILLEVDALHILHKLSEAVVIVLAEDDHTHWRRRDRHMLHVSVVVAHKDLHVRNHSA